MPSVDGWWPKNRWKSPPSPTVKAQVRRGSATPDRADFYRTSTEPAESLPRRRACIPHDGPSRHPLNLALRSGLYAMAIPTTTYSAGGRGGIRPSHLQVFSVITFRSRWAAFLPGGQFVIAA